MENKCPYCDYVTPTQEEGGGTRMWQEIAHMQTEHPEIIAERLRGAGLLDVEPGFRKTPVTTTICIPGDLSVEDLRRLVQLVATENHVALLKDEQLQRIETALDTTLMEIERKMS